MKDSLWFKSDGGKEVLSGFGQNLQDDSYLPLARSIKSLTASISPLGSNRCMISPFDYQPRTRTLFGKNTFERLGELARKLGFSPNAAGR